MGTHKLFAQVPQSDIVDLVSDLAGKAASSHAHAAGDTTSGTFNIARIPTGTSSSTVALGNHTHSSAAAHASTHLADGSDPLPIPGGVTPATILNLGLKPGQGRFKVQIARDGAASVETITGDGIYAGFDADPYFTVNAAKTAVQFRVRADSATTSGTSYPRSELRELDLTGADLAFDNATGTHRLHGRSKITHLPAVKPSIVVAQLHGGAASDLVQIASQLNGGSGLVELIVRINGSSSGLPKLSTNYAAGTEFEWKIECVNGVAAIYYNDMVTPVISGQTLTASTECYFKAGCYMLTNETIDAATEYGMVELRDFDVWHTGWTTPTKWYSTAQHAATHATGGQDPITPTSIGAAASSHTHGAADVASGTLDIARVPTGSTGTTVALGNHNHDSSYAASSHAHAAADVTSGTLAIARIPTGSTSSTVSLGDHTHAAAVVPIAPVTLTDAATIAVDASLGNHFRVTLAGNRTLGAPTNPTNGQKILIEVKQDATGSRTLAYNAIYRFGTDVTSPTLTTTASKTDFLGFVYNSTAAKWDCLAVAKGF